MENEEMTNDAAVAEIRLCSGGGMDGARYALLTRPDAVKQGDLLYSATTVAELRAEVERLNRFLDEGGRRLVDENARANAAERRVAELGALLDETRYWVGDDSEFPAELRLRIEAALTKESP